MSITRRFLVSSFVMTAVFWGRLNAAAMTQDNIVGLSFEAARQQALTAQKPVAVEFFSYKSVESKILRDRILARPEVSKILSEHYVFISLEQEKEPALLQKYSVSQVPVVVLFKADGSEIDRMGGRRVSAEQFKAFLEAGRQGRSSLAPFVAAVQDGEGSIEAHLVLADAYIKRQQDAEALREYQWCLNHGNEVNNKNYRKETVGIIRGLAVLGATLPEAKAVLREFRDGKEKQCKAVPSIDVYMVLFSCNAALMEVNRNTDAFLALPEGSPLRGQLFSSVCSDLLKQKKYQAVVSAVDLEHFVDEIYSILVHADGADHAEAKADKAKPHIHSGTPEMVEAQKHVLMDRASVSVEALMGTGQSEKARRIVGRVLEYDGSRLMRIRLLEAIRHSGAADADMFAAWTKNYRSSAELSETPKTVVETPAK